MKPFLLLMLTLITLHLDAKNVNIIEYGAIPDGETLNTQSIQTAIDSVFYSGGGRVTIPAGEFVSGSIILKSNVELYIQKRGVLLGSPFPSDYKKFGRWNSLILADGQQNIAITGRGTIDGQGVDVALHLDSLFYIGKIDSVDYTFPEKRPKYYLRPELIEIRNCSEVKIKNITLQNAACWVQTYEYCTNLIIDNVTVDSDAYWNNDGMDIIDCKNVSITNCDINSSDDGICLKSEDFSKERYSDNIYIANCRVRSSANAIKFGTSSVSGMRNVTIRNIKVYDTYRSAIAIEAAQGGILENILVEKVQAHNTGNAIFIRVGRIRGSKTPGQLRNVVLQDIKVRVSFKRPDYKYELRGPAVPYFQNIHPSSITGLVSSKVKNLKLKNIRITYPGRGNKAFAHMPLWRLSEVPELDTHYPEFSMFGELPAWGFYVRHVKGLTLENVTVKIKNPDYREAFVFDDVVGLRLNSVKVLGDKPSKKKFIFHQSEDIQVK